MQTIRIASVNDLFPLIIFRQINFQHNKEKLKLKEIKVNVLFVSVFYYKRLIGDLELYIYSIIKAYAINIIEVLNKRELFGFRAQGNSIFIASFWRELSNKLCLYHVSFEINKKHIIVNFFYMYTFIFPWAYCQVLLLWIVYEENHVTKLLGYT